jgi:hypothetical protein
MKYFWLICFGLNLCAAALPPVVSWISFIDCVVAAFFFKLYLEART